MERIFSARIDDRIVRRIGDLAQKLHTSKKAVLEQAVEMLGRQVDSELKDDVFDRTNGVWDRNESAAQTVSRIREAFRKSMERHAQ